MLSKKRPVFWSHDPSGPITHLNVLHHTLHAVHVEHDLPESPEDEVLKLHLVLLAKDDRLGQAAHLDKVRHKVLVLLKECIEGEKHLLELGTLRGSSF